VSVHAPPVGTYTPAKPKGVTSDVAEPPREVEDIDAGKRVQGRDDPVAAVDQREERVALG
jgi:hypothetical protein